MKRSSFNLSRIKGISKRTSFEKAITSRIKISLKIFFPRRFRSDHFNPTKLAPQGESITNRIFPPVICIGEK
jgi:hypothetical protein